MTQILQNGGISRYPSTPLSISCPAWLRSQISTYRLTPHRTPCKHRPNHTSADVPEPLPSAKHHQHLPQTQASTLPMTLPMSPRSVLAPASHPDLVAFPVPLPPTCYTSRTNVHHDPCICSASLPLPLRLLTTYPLHPHWSPLRLTMGRSSK